MASRRTDRAARIALAVVLALGLHALIIALVLVARPLAPSESVPTSMVAGGQRHATEDDRPLEIENLVDELKSPDQSTPEEKKRAAELKKEEEQKNPAGQVVDLPRPAIEERPDKSKYVSEFDSRVDRETKGPNGRDRAGARTAAHSPGQDAVTQPAAPAAPANVNPAARPGVPGPVAMRMPANRSVPAAAPQTGGARPLEPPVEGGELERSNPGAQSSSPRSVAPSAPQRKPPASGGQGGVPGTRGNDRPNLAATPEMLERAIARGAGSMDYLKDIDDGESTALNAKKWIHAPFFNRVKRAVADEWHPDVVYVRHDPSGNVYGIKDRVTVLRIHLKPDGGLAAWTVLESSGVDFLDDEAIEAFRKAQPFPNPPRELVEKDGQIHFNFAFIFELSGHTSLKVYKYQ